MYARRVTLNLKPNSSSDFTNRMNTEVIPVLKRQKGFQDEFAFTQKDGKEAFGISLWDRKESADAYEQGDYSQVKAVMQKLADGEPRVEGYEVNSTTYHTQPAANTK